MEKTNRRTRLERADSNSAAAIIAFVIIAIYCVSLLLVFGWGLISSFKNRIDFRNNYLGLPAKWIFSNFTAAFKVLSITVESGYTTREILLLEMIFYSLIISIVPTFIRIIWTAICTYTLAKYNFKGRKLIYNTFILIMILPIIGTLPSQLSFQMSLGVYDNIFWLILTSPTIWTGPFLILYAVYRSLSWEFVEAAFIDGAGHHAAFWNVMLPLSKTSILVLFLLAFIVQWNDYQLSLIFLPSYPTISYGLYRFQFSKNYLASSATIQMAAGIMASLPSFILFMVFKDKMMGALTMGGLKG